MNELLNEFYSSFATTAVQLGYNLSEIEGLTFTYHINIHRSRLQHSKTVPNRFAGWKPQASQAFKKICYNGNMNYY